MLSRAVNIFGHLDALFFFKIVGQHLFEEIGDKQGRLGECDVDAASDIEENHAHSARERPVIADVGCEGQARSIRVDGQE